MEAYLQETAKEDFWKLTAIGLNYSQTPFYLY